MSVAEAVAPNDLYITSALYRRAPKRVDFLREKLALQDIAAQMVDDPEQVLPRLVERAMEITGAASAGISAFEPQEGTAGIFRWRDLRGELARFEGSITPRNYSPCGVCLDRFEPTLTRRPERYYTWIAEAGVCCPEVLLAPLYIAHGQPLGTLWIVAEREGDFDSGHARIIQELASFVGDALAMVQDKQRLEEALKQQEMLAAEMSHRVKNLFSVVDAMICASKRSVASAGDMAAILSGRLHALATAHSLVRRSFSRELDKSLPPTASLKAVIDAILEPYAVADAERLLARGPEIALGSHATTSIALVLHEFATNAAKYGALASDEGRVSVSWREENATLAMRWRESGGPAIVA
ncbi:MAG: GAF domain-containing protein, partial [Hyphomicrobiales bacterium]|nr:GAF domain-containing protein [Hyphomicrobiales bacterium]MBV8661755.1 GAF domain-containing protein [Hyphomicrobiales bacterium]